MANAGDESRVVPPPDAPITGRGLRTFAVPTQLADGSIVWDNLQAVVLVDKFGEPIDFHELVAALTELNFGISRLVELSELKEGV
jgi:hypothetical protein